ncbi:MAG: putative holliday junction resolvase [Acidobacteria bacterium]|nr:putative holliday junction resolvase [Acidobacteriota bacterium]
MQEKDTTNPTDFTDVFSAPNEGRIIALDLGTKRLGVAVCDELQITVRPLFTLKRQGWKKLLVQIKDILAEYDARALVLGLPYNFDGTESEMSEEARRVARNFSLSLPIPVFLQDERMTSYDARGNLWKNGADKKEMLENIDSHAAAIILSDFLSRKAQTARNI